MKKLEEFKLMPRHEYLLTTETIKVINGHAQDVAEEAGYSATYCYGIVENKVTDPFSVFVHLFSAAVRAGCDVTHWLNRLDAIQVKYAAKGSYCIDTEIAKATKESSDVPVARLSDKPLYDQLNETCQAISQLENVKRAILHAIAEDKEGPNVRRFSKDAVARRRA